MMIRLILSFLIISQAYTQNKHYLGMRIKYSSSFNNTHSLFSESDNQGNGIYSLLKMNFGNFKYINEMCASPNRDDMLRGSGKKMAGLYGYSNLGYIEYKVEKKALKNTFTFGRSYLNHSLSKYGSILISRWSRPFDNMTWALNYKGLSGKISVIELDEIENNNRYLSAHSLNLRFNTLTLYLAETALYAGKNRFLEFQYINPTLLWLPIRENQPNSKQANNTIYVGVSYETGKFRLFSEFLLDDYQKDEYMLEPATFGYIVGVDSLSTNIIKYLSFKYTKIANRTYQTHNNLGIEDYTHRDFSIGHYLGNDFDQFHLKVNLNAISYKSQKFIPELQISFSRDGSNGIETDWDSPWLESENLKNGEYTENFPTKPFDEIFEAELSSKINKSSVLGLYFKSEKSQVSKSRLTSLGIVFRTEIGWAKYFLY